MLDCDYFVLCSNVGFISMEFYFLMSVYWDVYKRQVYIGDTFKDIELLQKSYVGISRGGLADPKVVENSDIVLIDANLNRVYETFVIARHMRTIAVMNNILTVVVKIAMLIVALSWTAIPLWIIVLIEILLKAFVMRNSTCIL